ncbi:MAG: preprotein translocase subunit SecE [Lachnospiraceae bacterium]|jgi:preprotein translocase, secE subunit
MAETKTTETTPKKKGFFKGLKAEFGRIIWPDKDTVWKESAAVLAVSVILALVIAGMDFLIQIGLDAIL